MQNIIPKRIIQTGKHIHLPIQERAAVANLKLLNPDFEYLFFDNQQVEAFLDSEFPEYRTVFDGFRYPIQRYDFFRYLAVYRYGGFYFDLDVLLASELSSLLRLSCVFPFEELTLNHFLRGQYEMDWELGNYAFAAAPEHPFLHAVIQNCARAQRDPEWVTPMMRGLPRLFRTEFYVLNTTGPGLLSRTLAENPHLSDDITVLFPKDVCDSGTWHQFGDFGVHLMQGSWRVGGPYLRRRLGNVWEVWARRRALDKSRRRGGIRRLGTRSRLAPAGVQL
jgi:hypothetical protein